MKKKKEIKYFVILEVAETTPSSNGILKIEIPYRYDLIKHFKKGDIIKIKL